MELAHANLDIFNRTVSSTAVKQEQKASAVDQMTTALEQECIAL